MHAVEAHLFGADALAGGQAPEAVQNFSIVNCSRMLELAEAMFESVATDGYALFDPSLDP